MLAPGTLIDDKYEVVSQVGTGGFGTVYQAHQIGLDRTVAVKMFGGHGFADAQDALRFEQEAKAISLLSHRNIVAFRGYGIWQETPYMVMEFLSGKSLEAALANAQPLKVRAVIQIMLQLCDALTCAHAHGIIHRDLKPSNVLLSENVSSTSYVRVIDFGLAKLLAPDTVAQQRLTVAGTALGSCPYMSPEQCLGQEVDVRTDIYSAGCIFYYCLTGQPVFDGDNPIAIMHQHVNVPVPRLAAGSAFIEQAAALQSILDRALCKNRDERYASAADMAADLTALEKDLPNVGFELTRNVARSFKVNGKVLAGVVALAALLSLFWLNGWWSSSQAPPVMTFDPNLRVDSTELDRQEDVLYRANKSMIDGDLPQALVAYREVYNDEKMLPQLRVKALEGVVQVYSRQRNFDEVIKNLQALRQAFLRVEGRFSQNGVMAGRQLTDLYILNGKLREARELLVRDIEDEPAVTAQQKLEKLALQHKLAQLDLVLQLGAPTGPR